MYKGRLYGKLLLYEENLSNGEIAEKIDNLDIERGADFFADSAEKKSIDQY